MFQHVNPNGISISQAKKDAKKLSKKDDISLSEAQDLIAFKHSRSSWAQAMNQMKCPIKLNFKDLSLNSKNITFPDERSISFVIGKAGTGKTLLVKEIMKQLLKNGIPVTYISTQKFMKNDLLHNLMLKYPQLISVYDVSVDLHSEIKTDFSKIALKGGVLIIDEAFYVFKTQSKEEINDLLLCSKHSIIVYQSAFDISKGYVPDSLFEGNHIQGFIFNSNSEELEAIFTREFPNNRIREYMSHLHNIENDHRKFIYASRSVVPVIMRVNKPIEN